MKNFFSKFWFRYFVSKYHVSSKAGVLNILGLAYPLNKIVPLCVPPNQNCTPFAYPQIKNSTQINLFWVVFKIWRTPCEPPRGTRTLRLRTAALWCLLQNVFVIDKNTQNNLLFVWIGFLKVIVLKDIKSLQNVLLIN